MIPDSQKTTGPLWKGYNYMIHLSLILWVIIHQKGPFTTLHNLFYSIFVVQYYILILNLRSIRFKPILQVYKTTEYCINLRMRFLVYFKACEFIFRKVRI